jgi:hypothetical protein
MTIRPEPFNYRKPHVYNFRAPGPIKPISLPTPHIVKQAQEPMQQITVKPKKPTTERTYTKVSLASLRMKAEISDLHARETLHCKPDEVLVKTWTCKNTGGQPWPAGLKLHFSPVFSNARMECPADHPHMLTLCNPEIPPGESYELEIKLTAPSQPGTYTEAWQLGVEGKLIPGIIKVSISVDGPE